MQQFSLQVDFLFVVVGVSYRQPTPLAGVGRHPRLVPRMTGEGCCSASVGVCGLRRSSTDLLRKSVSPASGET